MKSAFVLLALLLVAVVAVYTFSDRAADPIAGDYFYSIESGGVICGYAVVDTAMTVVDGRRLMVVEQSIVTKQKLLGMDLDSNVEQVFHIDPADGQFVSYMLDVDQGQRRITSSVSVEEDGAHCSTSLGREDHVVELSPETVLENPIFFMRVLEDLAVSDSGETEYQMFDVMDQQVHGVRYTRVREEAIELAGTEYKSVIVNKRNLVTGADISMWLDTNTGMCLKVVVDKHTTIALADPSVARKLERVVADDAIMTPANRSIPDVSGVSYMKVRARIRPTGLIVTMEALNVPGQRFTGSVEDNLIDGVFEIEHPRYDGTNAPPFPPDFGDAPELAPYLEPSVLIESNDPELVEKARELTLGSVDSWEATRRLSEWVSTEIGYAIPGGGSAKGVYDMKVGECGGHSVLLAAFCRSVGIPARVVWGVMYVPDEGGKFGQHGWDEIYMGSAGWIPVDATASEIDFVDSGHIRLGLFESFATRANSKEFDILDYRIAGVTDETAGAAEEKYAAYVGEYKLRGMSKPCKVRVQDGSLVVDLPDNVALAFSDPDEEGRWQCKLAPHVFLTFGENDRGEMVEAQLYERYKLPRQPASADASSDVPAEYSAYVGNYRFAAINAEFTIDYKRGHLRMYHPLQKKTSTLSEPNEEGGWAADNDRHTVYFERDADGSVNAMTLESKTTFKR